MYFDSLASALWMNVWSDCVISLDKNAQLTSNPCSDLLTAVTHIFEVYKSLKGYPSFDDRLKAYANPCICWPINWKEERKQNESSYCRMNDMSAEEWKMTKTRAKHVTIFSNMITWHGSNKITKGAGSFQIHRKTINGPKMELNDQKHVILIIWDHFGPF